MRPPHKPEEPLAIGRYLVAARLAGKAMLLDVRRWTPASQKARIFFGSSPCWPANAHVINEAEKK